MCMEATCIPLMREKIIVNSNLLHTLGGHNLKHNVRSLRTDRTL